MVNMKIKKRKKNIYLCIYRASNRSYQLSFVCVDSEFHNLKNYFKKHQDIVKQREVHILNQILLTINLI